MNAGIDLDILVGETFKFASASPFSSEIYSAMAVVEKMQDDKWDFRLESSVGKDPLSGLMGKRYYMGAFLKDYKFIREYANTPSLAICLAALRAVGVNVSELEPA